MLTLFSRKARQSTREFVRAHRRTAALYSITQAVLYGFAGGGSLLMGQQVRERVIETVPDGGVRLELSEVVRIGAADGGPKSFGRVMDATFDTRGRIIVADDLNHEVKVFSANGEYVGTVGREGRGPGEFQSPWVVATGPADSLFVWDSGLARISVFSPNLEFARSMPVPPYWLLTGIEFLPDGNLLVAAYGPTEKAVLHVLDRNGKQLRMFGPSPQSTGLGGYEGSLLGGHIDVLGRTIVYTNKSPYDIRVYDLDGNLTSHCTGKQSWTTDPREVIVRNETGEGLRWNRFVHSSNILMLSDRLFLNVVHDPVENVRRFDLI